MGKRSLRQRRGVVLRATAFPLALGVLAAAGLSVYQVVPAGSAVDRLPAEAKSDLLPMNAAAEGVRVAQAEGTGALSVNPASRDQTTELDRLALEAQLTKGYAHLARQDYKAAREIFATAVEKHGNRADLWRQLGYIEANLGNRTAAIDDFAKALELEPDNEQTKTVLEQMRTQAELEKGYAALCEKNYGSAREVFVEAIAKDPDNAELWRQLGYIELGLGNKQAAIDAFTKTLEITPGDPQLEAEIDRLKFEPVVEEGYQKLQEKDYEAALDIFRRALESHPERADLWKQLAFIQSTLGKSAEAAAAFDKASDLEAAKLKDEEAARKAKLDVEIGKAYEALCSKDFETARTAYMRAVEIDPDRADLWNQLGQVETNLGNLDAAGDAFDRARALEPVN